MNADISNVVNVALLPEGRLAGRDNANVVAIITSDAGGPLNSAKRFELYANLAAVASDWGTLSDVYAHASAFFATRPNPVNVGGMLVVGFWRATSETVPASPAELIGAELNQAAVVGLVQGIADGGFALTVDGDAVTIDGLDFSASVSLADIVNVLNGAVPDDELAFELRDGRIVGVSATTGSASTITLASAPAAGTNVATVLGLAAGTGAQAVPGAASSVLAAESMLDAATELKARVNVKGLAYIDPPTTTDVMALAMWASASSVLVYDVFSSPSNLEVAAANPVWTVTSSGLTNYRMLYSKAGNRQFATAYMARTHTVNFSAENTAMTMQLKELPVPAESYDQGEITAAARVGLDVYTMIKDVPIVLTSGANDFVDNPYNLMAYVDAVQTDMFNLLKGTATKIPQTNRGIAQMVDAAEKTTRGFVRAGVFAPGVWSSPDTFGDYDTFMRNITTAGFYVLAGSLADQPQSERQERRAPPLQIAVKNAGAVHRADIIINFNR